MFAVLKRYNAYARVLAICHGQAIKAITGVAQIELAGVVKMQL